MILDAAARVLERPLRVREPFTPLDAIVVLGAPLAHDGSLTRILAERAAAAAALYRAGAAPRIVTSGGITRSPVRAEADALAEAIRAHGIPDVLVENRSQNTIENARFTHALIPDARSVWLVTTPFHARRARRVFRNEGFDAHAWHIDDSLQYTDRPKALKWLAREYAAWTVHFARELTRRELAPLGERERRGLPRDGPV